MKPYLSKTAKVGTAAALALLYAPLLAVAVLSFNSSKYGLAWKGFTFDWYARLFSNETILEAARNTLILAAASTAIATPLGTLLALGASRAPWPKGARRLIDLCVYLPIVTPDILFAAALVIAFAALRPLSAIFEPGLPAMIIAHVTFQIAFVAVLVGARLATIGGAIEEAARDLYADTPTLLRRVIIPLLWPAIAAGAVLAFTLSLDDFIISFFVKGPQSTTLPIYIQASVRRGVTPEIHALSFLIFLANVLLVIALERLMRLRAQPAEATQFT